MKSMTALLTVLMLTMTLRSDALPDGAPKSACSTLKPVHEGAPPQNSDPPYTITAVRKRDTTRVRIWSSVGEQLSGFLLQARSRDESNRLAQGKFVPLDTHSKTLDCFGGKENSLTHTNPTPKKEILTDFVHDTKISHEEVVFRATVAKSFSEYWMGIESVEGPTSEGPGSEYEGCSLTKGCFGIPRSCIGREECHVFLSYKDHGYGIQFHMRGRLQPRTYMAMALSYDSYMGDDAVVECFPRNSGVVCRDSWTEGKSVVSSNVAKAGCSGRYDNGVTSCDWTTDYLVENNGRKFDLANNTYHLLLATGPVQNNNLLYHSMKLVTDEAVNFTASTQDVHHTINIHDVEEEESKSTIESEHKSGQTDILDDSTSDKESIENHKSQATHLNHFSRITAVVTWCALWLILQNSKR